MQITFQKIHHRVSISSFGNGSSNSIKQRNLKLGLEHFKERTKATAS